MGSYLLVRLTEEDKADLFIFAKQHRTTASEIVRQFIRGTVRPGTSAPHQQPRRGPGECHGLAGPTAMNKRPSPPDKVNLYIVILADTNLSATSKVIAGWLLFNHHNTVTGICTPSNRTIGKAIGIRPENVSRNIGMLVKAGYLLVRRRFGTSNSYDFDWSKGGKGRGECNKEAS